MKSFWMGLGFAVTVSSIFVACSTTPKAPMTAQKFQEVEFAESEVPYIQSVKKDGKVTAVIVDTTKPGTLSK